MTKLIHRQTGLTLLEIMLVLAVSAVILVAGLSVYSIRVRNTKVDQAALAMQQWLQAGMAYYVNESSWPHSLQQLVDTGYMPAGLDQVIPPNPWGRDITVVTPSSPTTHYFQIKTLIPATVHYAESIAKQIAAKLPNGQSQANGDADEYEITSAVTIPGQASEHDSGRRIAWVGTIYINDPNPQPDHLTSIPDNLCDPQHETEQVNTAISLVSNTTLDTTGGTSLIFQIKTEYDGATRTVGQKLLLVDQPGPITPPTPQRVLTIVSCIKNSA